tara:strand:+ start:1420 stop:1788 length:369 start_codon:yes stop_codon:yes gene_type:complete
MRLLLIIAIILAGLLLVWTLAQKEAAEVGSVYLADGNARLFKQSTCSSSEKDVKVKNTDGCVFVDDEKYCECFIDGNTSYNNRDPNAAGCELRAVPTDIQGVNKMVRVCSPQFDAKMITGIP